MQAKLEIKSPEKRGCEKSGVEMLHFREYEKKSVN